MAKEQNGGHKPKLKRVLEMAFPGDEAPGELSVAIVSLVELCDLAMPDPASIYQAIDSAGFAAGPQERADEFGNWLALDNKVFSFPVRNVKHKLWARDRHEARVRLLVSEGESAEGRIVFVSTIFGGAIEADAVKAAVHVSKKKPITGASLVNAQGTPVRRVFWDVEGASGMRGLMVTGPENVEAIDGVRAFTAFNIAGRKLS
jgi:hypothetical protein